MPDPFISTQDLVDLLGRGTITDPGMLIATTAACDVCRTEAEQTFNKGTTTVTLDGPGTDALLLPEHPVVTAGTVLVSGGTVTDYVVDTDRGLLIRKTATPLSIDWWSDAPLPEVRWPQGRQNVQVTYVHGYDSGEVPADVAAVALQVAARIVVQGPAIQETVGENSVRYAVPALGLTGGEKAILRKYRRN